MLAGTEIARALDSQVWKAYRDGERIEAKDLKINPHSVDVSLDAWILRPRRSSTVEAIDPRNPATQWTEGFEMPESGWILRPGDFVLGATRERFECSTALQTKIPSVRFGERDLSAWTYFHGVYDGRSTCARLGITSHQSAGYLDYGYSGCVTVELSTMVPVVLFPGMRIGQISFSPVQGVPDEYNGAYSQGWPEGPRAAELGKHRF